MKRQWNGGAGGVALVCQGLRFALEHGDIAHAPVPALAVENASRPLGHGQLTTGRAAAVRPAKCSSLALAVLHIGTLLKVLASTGGVDSAYFVRDSHHQVSVNRALGQDVIEAEVTMWEH